MIPSWLVLEKIGVWFNILMRRENLPYEGHDKLTWKRSGDRSRDKASRQRNFEAWWRRTTATSLDFSFENYRRRPRDVLIGRRGYIPLRRLGDVPLRCRWVFYLRLVWDVVERYHWDVLATFHWDVVECSIWDVPARSLGRIERRRHDVVTTSCCRVES